MVHRIAAALVLAVLTGPPARAADPVCALLDPERLPRAALLEAKLLADPGATWVERAGVDAVLKEQKLQALFAPHGVSDRVKLGALLKADVLVTVRAAKGAPEPALEVAVSETASGLRLAVAAVPVTASADADAAALARAVRDGLRRHGQKVTEVVAVPPFVSNDLEYTHDHLKGAYAKLAEAEALGRPGVVVVELAEAEALAKELALAAPGTALRARPLPVYLLGEYRHDGAGKDRTVALKLRAERGGKALPDPAQLKLSPGGSPAAVRKWAAGVLDGLAKGGAPRPPADPKAEARQLADRGRVFVRLGNWPEALALIEASLLLDPDQTALYAGAVRALAPAVRAAWQKGQQDAAAAEQMAAHYRRALAHLEAFFAHGGDPADYRELSSADFVTALRLSANSLHWTGSPPKRVAELLDELRRDEREAFLRVAAAAAKNGSPDAHYVWWAVAHLSAREKYAAVEKLLADLRGLPDLTARAVAYASLGHATPQDPAEFRALLDRLAASEDKALREAAAVLRARAAAKPAAAPAAPPGPGPGGVKFTPIALRYDAEVPADAPTRNPVGVLAVDATTDVVWSSRALYAMTEKGKLRLLWRADGANDDLFVFASVGFDGRYVWAALTRLKGRPLVVVADPRAGKAWEVGAADGLPAAPAPEATDGFGGTTVLAAPLDPGRACLVGAFRGRAWVGVATIDPTAGTAAVKVIHEAKDAPDRLDPDQWKTTTVAFTPALAVAVAAPGRPPERRVLVARRVAENHRVQESPLVIDPDRGTASVLPDRNWAGVTQGGCAARDGAVYFLPFGSPLLRFALPGLAREAVADSPARARTVDTRIAIHDGRAHLLVDQEPKRDGAGRTVRPFQWVTVGLDGANPRLVASDLPPLRGAWASAHYGLIALVEDPAARRLGLHTVEFAAPAAKK